MTAIPYAVPPAPVPVGKPSAMPDGPRLYTEMMRGPRRRWWKPVVALLAALGLYLVFNLVVLVPLGVFGALGSGESLFDRAFGDNPTDPVSFVVLNVVLIALIPTAGLSIWIVHRIRPRFLSSVAGGIRWRWLVRCVLILTPLWLVYLGIGFWLDLPTPGRPEQWVLILILGLVLTPFQAAGEEYFFRGWIMQNIGAYFGRPLIGLIVTVALSTVLFSAAHGSPDPWILGSIGCLAVASGIATQRTGGLEAGIAMHAVNNVLIGIFTTLYGGYADSLVDQNTEGDPIQFVTAVVVHALALALVLWQARKHKIDPYYRPVAGTDAPPALEAGGPWPEASWNPIPELNRTPAGVWGSSPTRTPSPRSHPHHL